MWLCHCLSASLPILSESHSWTRSNHWKRVSLILMCVWALSLSINAWISEFHSTQDSWRVEENRGWFQWQLKDNEAIGVTLSLENPWEKNKYEVITGLWVQTSRGWDPVPLWNQSKHYCILLRHTFVRVTKDCHVPWEGDEHQILYWIGPSIQ